MRSIVIDEVQKVPALLDEVHWLMESRALSFLLTGSSARKLRRGHAWRRVLVCLEKEPRRLPGGVEVLPWRLFLERLWAGDFRLS